MSKLYKLFIPVLIVIFSLIIVSSPVKGQDVRLNQNKFAQLLRLVDSYYVDSTDINELTETAIVKLLEELDPHSVYISKEEVERRNEELSGSFDGIGISFNIFKDTLLVATTIPGGPSEKVGLRAGDRILFVDNKNIAGIGLTNTDVLDMLRGEKGTIVILKIKRNHISELLDFTIIRDAIPINSLDASYMIEKEIGYIKLNRFSATTSDEFLEALNDLKEEGLENLILDLRGNGGGYLSAAIEIADNFLADEKMIVYTNGLKRPQRDYKATENGEFETGKLAILVDEGSASASEIVSGAVQDWDRGIIIGRRSFGKGLVQEQHMLADGSMIRLTTAHYYTPTGRCIQKPYEGVDDYNADYQRRLDSGELFTSDSITFDDNQKYYTLENGRLVFGGGGIMPDIFIPMDTSSNYQYYNKLRRNNIVNNYVIDFIDKNRETLVNNYPEFDDYINTFKVSNEMINDLVAQGESEGIEKDQESLDFTLQIIQKEIKALIARNLFSNNQFYEIYNSDDQAIMEALDLLRSQDKYNNLLVYN